MNDPENFDSPPGVDSSAPESLEKQFESLRQLFFATLVALLIFSVGFNVFLIRQTTYIRKDLNAMRPQVSQLIANYQKTEEPQIKSFVNALVAFGKSHPDFNSILAKYKIVSPTPALSAPATGSSSSTNRKK